MECDLGGGAIALCNGGDVCARSSPQDSCVHIRFMLFLYVGIMTQIILVLITLEQCCSRTRAHAPEHSCGFTLLVQLLSAHTHGVALGITELGSVRARSFRYMSH